MKDNNYVVIQGWMCNQLNLKGNELLIYALIYGFSQDDETKFSGGRKYISETFNISLPTVDKALQSLLDKTYITKHMSGDFVRPDTYQANLEVVKFLYQGSKVSLLGGGKETLLNNIDNKKINKQINNNISKDILLEPNMYDDVSDKLYNNERPKRKNLYDKCLDYIYEKTDDLELQDLLVTFLKMRLEVKDKPLYFNMWKGMLNKLLSMSDKLDTLCNIVQQSIDKGWLAFYEIKSFGKKNDIEVISGEFGTVSCAKNQDEVMTDEVF